MITGKEIYQKLLERYGNPPWWSSDPYIVIVQSVLVQNTQWRRVESVTAAFGDRLTPEAVVDMSEEELEVLVNDLQYKTEGLDVSAFPTGSVSGLPVALHPCG